MAPQHPEWKNVEPFKSVIAGDREALAKFTERDWFEIVGATHSGMSTDEFPALVRPWLEAARDPRFKRPFHGLSGISTCETDRTSGGREDFWPIVAIEGAKMGQKSGPVKEPAEQV